MLHEDKLPTWGRQAGAQHARSRPKSGPQGSSGELEPERVGTLVSSASLHPPLPPRDEGTFRPSFISQVLQLLKGEQASTSKAQRGLITVFPGLGGPQMTGSQGGQSVIIRGKVALDHGKSLDVGLLHQMAGEP